MKRKTRRTTIWACEEGVTKFFEDIHDFAPCPDTSEDDEKCAWSEHSEGKMSAYSVIIRPIRRPK
jgi:hypothetical protein